MKNDISELAKLKAALDADEVSELHRLRAENERLKAIEKQHVEFVLSATRTADRMSAENADMKFRIEGDAILLQAANQTIKKERAKVAGYQSEQTGLRQTISDQFGRIMDLEGEKAELLAALQKLYDEQNDAPLETRRHEWNRAMARAGELLKKYEHDGK